MVWWAGVVKQSEARVYGALEFEKADGSVENTVEMRMSVHHPADLEANNTIIKDI
jgi:hypothetical protein